jgi:Domain of unknown function (DUF6457)
MKAAYRHAFLSAPAAAASFDPDMIEPAETSAGDPTQWVAAFARALGLDPVDPHTIEVVLDLASVAAHQSQRWAAPVAAFLAGRAGLDPTEALQRARALASPR